MSSSQLITIAILSYWIPFISILIRYKAISKYFLPFCLIITITTIGENALLLFDVSERKFLGVYYNFYYNLEAILLAIQFKVWGIFKTTFSKLFIFILILLGVIGLNFLFLTKIDYELSLLIPVYSVAIILFCVKAINNISNSYYREIYHHPIFTICCGLILYNTFSIINILFYYDAFNISREIRYLTLDILNVITVFCSIIYAYSIFEIDSRKDKMQLLN